MTLDAPKISCQEGPKLRALGIIAWPCGCGLNFAFTRVPTVASPSTSSLHMLFNFLSYKMRKSMKSEIEIDTLLLYVAVTVLCTLRLSER